MSIKDSVVNVVIKAKNLAADKLKRFRSDLNGVSEEAKKSDNVLGRLAKTVAGTVAAFFGFSAIKNSIVSVLTAGDKFEGLRIQLNALTGSAEEGGRAFEWVKEFTKSTPLQLEETTNAFARLKAFGLDPMDGTMQAIVDQSEKLGGGQERLMGIANALGQAWAKQKLQGEEILQLVERGVPVYELLAQVTGKNATELQKMQENGELTRDVIKQVIDAMGQGASGAASANMDRLSGIISNLKDQWTEFLVKISDAGAMESAKKLLGDLADEVVRLTKDGSIDRWAKQISGGIASIGSGIKSTVGFVREYSSEILALGRAFVAIKVVQLTGSIASAGAAFIAAAANTKIFSASVTGASVAVGKLQIALSGLGAFVVGWEIGTYLRKKFDGVALAGNELVRAYEKTLARMQAASDKLSVWWNDDAKTAISEKLKKRLAEIDGIVDQMNNDVIGVKKNVDDLVGTLDDIPDKKEIKVEADTTNAAKALDDLKVDAEASAKGFTAIELEAIRSFKVIVDQIDGFKYSAEKASAVLRDSFTAAFKSISSEKAGEELIKSLNEQFAKGKISAEDYGKAVKATKEKMDKLRDAARGVGEEAEKTAKKVRSVGDAGEEAGDKMAAAMEGARAAAASVGKFYDGITARLSALSGKAVSYFRELQGAVSLPADGIEAMKNRISDLSDTFSKLKFGPDADFIGITRWMRGVALDSNKAEVSYLKQKVALESLLRSYENGSISASDLAASTAGAASAFDLLDDADLSALRGAIESARQEVEALQDSTLSTLEGLQNELDRMRGNTADVERRQYQARVRELQDQIADAQEIGDQESIANLQKALQVSKQIYQVKAAEVESEKKAAAERAKTQQAEKIQADTKPTTDQNQKNTPTISPVVAQPSQVPTKVIRLELGEKSVEVTTNDEQALLDLLEQAARRV